MSKNIRRYFMKNKMRTLWLMLVLSLALTACGGGETKPEEDKPQVEENAEGEEAPAEGEEEAPAEGEEEDAEGEEKDGE